MAFILFITIVKKMSSLSSWIGIDREGYQRSNKSILISDDQKNAWFSTSTKCSIAQVKK